MVTKKSTGKRKVAVGKLKLNRETISDLSSSDAKRVNGGNVAIAGLIGVVVSAVKTPPPPPPPTQGLGICATDTIGAVLK